MSTNNLKAKDIERKWHLFDAKNKILGRFCTEIATVLMGKNKSDFVTYLDNGDFVVVINADKVKVSGNKEIEKKYYHHSGYPGGMRVQNMATVRTKKPEEIIRAAVWGMIPKTKLGRDMIIKLHIYAGTDHPYKKQLKEENKDAK